MHNLHQTLTKIVNRLGSKYSHDIHDIDDLRQEAYFVGLKANEKYTEDKGPLENFLASCISNHFINMVKHSKRREGILNSESLSYMSTDRLEELTPVICDEDNFIDEFDSLHAAARSLHSEMRKDFLKVLGGVKVSKKRRDALYEFFLDNCK